MQGVLVLIGQIIRRSKEGSDYVSWLICRLIVVLNQRAEAMFILFILSSQRYSLDSFWSLSVRIVELCKNRVCKVHQKVHRHAEVVSNILVSLFNSLFAVSLKTLSLPMLPYGLPTESYSICDHAIIAVDSTDSSEGNSFHLVFLDESRVDYHLPCWWGVCFCLRVFWCCLGDGIILVRLLWYVSFANHEGTGTIPLVYAFSESSFRIVTIEFDGTDYWSGVAYLVCAVWKQRLAERKNWNQKCN